MLTKKDLNRLIGFGKEKDGSYSDRWQFDIKKVKKNWCLFFFSEVDGSTWFIKKLKDLNDLQNVYYAITNKQLEMKDIVHDELVIGWFGIPGGKTGTKTHIVKLGKPVCGTQIHKDAEFQWCSSYQIDIECEHCKKYSK
ncbi:MAG: hypothetical protein ACC656_08135 [Candidatus Heimdallarchaeota archaeon]